MSTGELVASTLKVIFILLSLVSVYKFINGLIVLRRSKSLKPLIHGIIWISITLLLFFTVVILGQILSLQYEPVDIPPLRDSIPARD